MEHGPPLEGDILEVLAARRPCAIPGCADDVRFASDWQRNFRGLWEDSWNERRRADMRVFIPMGSARSEIIADRPWRIEYRSVARRRTRDLLLLLDDADFAIQYAAGMRLVLRGDSSTEVALIEWFLKRPARFKLRVVSRLDTLRVLDALVDFLKTQDWQADWLPGDRIQLSLGRFGKDGLTREFRARHYTFERDLGFSIGRFGERSVPRLTPLLAAENVCTQMATLRALGETGVAGAVTLILDWLHTLKADDGDQRRWLVRRALLALGKLGHTDALPLLKEILSGKVRDVDSRWAIEALVLFKHDDARSVLERFARRGRTSILVGSLCLIWPRRIRHFGRNMNTRTARYSLRPFAGKRSISCDVTIRA